MLVDYKLEGTSLEYKTNGNLMDFSTSKTAGLPKRSVYFSILFFMTKGYETGWMEHPPHKGKIWMQLNEGEEGVSLEKHDPWAELGGSVQFQKPSTCENRTPGYFLRSGFLEIVQRSGLSSWCTLCYLGMAEALCNF